MIFRILEEQYGARLAAEKAAKAQATPSDAADHRYMQLALTLGRRGLGRTGTNPAVGAVLVKDGVIVGRGWTQDGGRPHAEVEALRRAGEAARGATLYVTLEPCSHHGRSPPCADAIVAAGVARVVSAIEDPNPLVGGQGHARLRDAGIAVEVGLCAGEAARDHAGHLLRVREQRPHVVLKLAVSADDRIAAAGRKPVAITGEAARARVHLLRAQSDAILVGIGTVLADDPELTCRLPGMAALSPIRVVLDRSLRISGDSKLVHSARQTPLWLMASEIAEAASAMRLGAAGAEVIHVADCADTPGLDLPAVLRALSAKGVTRLLIEGGAQTARAIVAGKLADEIWLLRGPAPIGEGGLKALDGVPLTAITAAPDWRERSCERIGDDTLTIYDRT
ncbi:bifunctional diaminohydroxyphosphoribosylaminopyrimidine deaminase/5-amino-6-(5-phosphoribosylamino)uracil reductase RibD [Rhodopseudomonas sp. HC1]|uniref:bifunctional diaminohydroxyphosphoribosylaminopyrimidine deaminase/5-amino-6-(5-phosphoribosylamino)uracil reductase RibD n=1 Tax=Rhodopseudomonas infernalis TaxID=2897386 RepID=UPI001EE7F72C|nr:bifunctional diaminohydroxyphosphoribosylaminopyrimidine deaminase/5-amino-6-(5-phosphoribosylamino)uracil reductase RibD [Rhodopseudomonas infernalis]MCG6207130.1 bifunctional diaminohydroxyphosphoribosylaminopyrimidine deaminase/5-amino-6-(5-phosphoribosylamino)uracil reductase RibD [Rhodopseudomonas infernalis]